MKLAAGAAQLMMSLAGDQSVHDQLGFGSELAPLTSRGQKTSMSHRETENNVASTDSQKHVLRLR